MKNTLWIIVGLALALPSSAQEITEVYEEGQNLIVDIPYFEMRTDEGRKAYRTRLKAPFPPAEPLLFEVDWLSFAELSLTQENNPITCIPTAGETVSIETAQLYIEHNATDADTGIHGFFDDHGWSELCIYAPDGRQLLAVKPQGQLKKLMMSELFFESMEPPNLELFIIEFFQIFLEGQYEVRGVSLDGKGLVGFATFSHAIPKGPTITAPVLVADEEAFKDEEDEGSTEYTEVSIDNLMIQWQPVNH